MDRGRTCGFFQAMLLALLATTVGSMANDIDDGWCEDSQPPSRQIFRFSLENELFAGTDSWYRNGLRLAWISSDALRFSDSWAVPDWFQESAERLPVVNRRGSIRSVSLALERKSFTPENTTRANRQINDRPYAGWSYLSVGFHSRSLTRMDTLALQLGFVGPDSNAETTQRLVNEIFNRDHPRGWHHQLRNEPTLNLLFERIWRHDPGVHNNRWEIDVLPHLGFSLGNVYTYANGGGSIRFGWNLPRDFGGAILRPLAPFGAPRERGQACLQSQHAFSFYGFTGIDTRAIARNIFLDGNTWLDSHSVTKKNVIADVYAGFGLVRNAWTLSYIMTYRSPEFDGQTQARRFGSISISRSF